MGNPNVAHRAPIWLTCSQCRRDFQLTPRRFGDLVELHRREHLCPFCQRQGTKAQVA